MAKHQTRRSVSIRGATYAALRDDCAARDVSMSDHIEALIAADRAARGLPSAAVQRAVAAVQREGDRQVERIARQILKPLPSESKIVVGPPPEQTTMLGRAETPRFTVPPADPVRGVDPAPSLRGAALRPIVNAVARAHSMRRDRPAAPPPPIRSGWEEKPASAAGRPSPQRVATVAAPGPITKADPLAGVRSGRDGAVSF